VPSSARSSVASRLLGFSTLSLVSAIGPLLLLPVIARLSSQAEWAALGVGQSVGSFLLLPVLYGWNLVGPTRVARSAEPDRSALYRESLAVRLVLFVAMLPVGILVAAVLAPDGTATLAAAMAVSMLLVGLSPAWFCIGAARPGWLAAYDAGPRLAGTLAALPLALLTGEVFWYPLTIGVATALGALAFTWRHRPVDGATWPSPGQVGRALRRDGGPAATVAVGGSYSAAPVAIASTVLDVASLAVFVSAERIYRYGLTAVIALSDSVQGWVAEATGRPAERRAIQAVTAHSVLGIAGLGVITALGPWASGLLFGSELAVDRATFAGFGIAFLAVSVNTSLGKHVLVPLGRTGFVLVSTVSGAVVGVTAILVLGRLYGAAGAAVAFAVSEVAVTAVQAAGCFIAYRSRRQATPMAPLPG
jgi:O-antigen/teichoic acid export membrane protein